MLNTDQCLNPIYALGPKGLSTVKFVLAGQVSPFTVILARWKS
jgi:hypothetical protein